MMISTDIMVQKHQAAAEEMLKKARIFKDYKAPSIEHWYKTLRHRKTGEGG